MIYIYDMIVDKEDYEITYLDSEYQQSGRNMMENVEYLTYQRPGAEPLLVVPTYARQFEEAARKFLKVRKAHSHGAVVTRIQGFFRTEPEIDKMDYGNGEVVYYYTVNYKFIRIQMHLENGQLILDPTFTITKGNILGNFVTVSVMNNPELNQYCGES